jgi:hypothetical protein
MRQSRAGRVRRRAREAIERLPDDGEIVLWTQLGWRRLRRSQAPQRVLAPLAVNVAVHGALVLLLALAWTGVRPRGSEPVPEFALTLDEGIVETSAPPQETPAADEAGEQARSALAAAAEALAEGPGSLPELSRLSGAGGDLPALRSLSGGARDPSAMLGRGDRRIIGSASFAGVGAEQAGSVVYVVDASGAMVTSRREVIEELQRSISALKPTQHFQIVMFRDRRGGPALEVFNPGAGRPSLARATQRNKQAAFEWLGQVRPEGVSNPIEGLRRGLAFQPDVVFLLARSIVRSGEGAAWGAGREATLAELDALNPVTDVRTGRRRVQIKTIQFIDEDPSGVMRAIGAAHGGGAAGHALLTLEELRGR